jgi:predicted DNA-binding helix-hairpin-helix protein
MATTIIMEPDVQQKLAILDEEASDEVTDLPAAGSVKHATGLIYNAKPAGGGTSRLFKVLQTNACRYACSYCFTYT